MDEQARVDRMLTRIARRVSDARILAAFRAVRRSAFVEPVLVDPDDSAVDGRQTTAPPPQIASMLHALALEPSHQVLEVGTGTGYTAALLAQLTARVHTVERDAARAERARHALAALHTVEVRHGDGSLGWPEHAPFDAILLTAAAPEVPPSLRAQLAVGGRLVVPVGARRSQRCLRVIRTGADAWQHDDLGAVRFAPLVGAEGWPG